jgi:hypothetical protein
LILHDDVQIGLFLGQSRARLVLGLLRGGELAVRAPDRTTEIVDLRIRRVLPGLRPREVGDPELAVRETRGFVAPHPRRASLGFPALVLGSAFRVVRGFSRADGVPELSRRRVDVAIAVLAQGLERVLRIPRHSWGDPSAVGRRSV